MKFIIILIIFLIFAWFFCFSLAAMGSVMSDDFKKYNSKPRNRPFKPRRW